MTCAHESASQPLIVAFAAPPDPGVAESLVGRAGVEVRICESLRGEALARAAAEADVLVVRSWQRVDRKLLEQARPRLRAVVQASAGIDNIDAEAARELGVEVLAVDPGNATAVAELTLLGLLALFRRVRGHWEMTPAAHWPDREVLDDREIRGKTLGLVGVGRVGSRVARRAGAFEMKILAFDPYLSVETIAARGALKVDRLEDMLPRLDALSLHCPLTPETRGLIGLRELSLLRDQAVLINTARGGVLDAEALLAALASGRLAGAAIDVFPKEPPPPGPLLQHPRVLLTPHSGGHTAESHRARAENLIEAVARLLDRLAG